MNEPRVVFAGQGHWSRALAAGLARHANVPAAAVPFDTVAQALSAPRWRAVRRAPLLVLVGFRPDSPTVRGRLFSHALSLLGPEDARIVHYWIGSDVAKSAAQSRTSDGVARAESVKASGRRHIAGSAPLVKDLVSIGVDATLAPFPWEGVPQLESLPAMPSRFTVLSYVPDARFLFYGGPQLLEAARALPQTRFVIMGGAGTWASDAPENVDFSGWVDDPSPLYAGSSCVVRLAEYDSIGGTAVEGLVYGRPVIYTGELERTRHVAFDDTEQLTTLLAYLSRLHEEGLLAPSEGDAAWAASEFDPANRFRALAQTLGVVSAS